MADNSKITKKQLNAAMTKVKAYADGLGGTGGNVDLTDYAKKTDLPTKTTQLINDSGFITNSDIPANVSDLTNDAGYITADDIVIPSTEPSNKVVGSIWIV